MLRNNKLLISSIFGLIVTIVISFGNEIASYTISLSQINDVSMYNVSILVTSMFLGSILVTPVTIYLLNKLNIILVLLITFVIATISMLLATCFHGYSFYCLICFALGSTTSMFWSVLNTVIPSLFSKSNLVDVNKVLHAIRDSGYLLAPLIVGSLSYKIEPTLITLSVIFTITIILCIIPAFFINKDLLNMQAKPIKHQKFRLHIPISKFFAVSKMKSTLIPRLITICAMSIFHVAFMYQLLVKLNYNKHDYGLVLSATSIGIVLGPLLLASLFKQTNIATSSCICAVLIGFCIFFTGIYHNIIPLFIILFIIGVASGLQNTLISTFVMASINKDDRVELMPTYVSIIRFSILLGFIISSQILVRNSHLLLMITGSMVIIFGVLGATSNKYIKNNHNFN